jgi:polyribonucleotide nucleotidyltransferase
MAFKAAESSVMRGLVLREGTRADGRGVTDVRPITSRAALLPRTHGSALFTRGETQVRRCPSKPHAHGCNHY